MNWNGKTIKGIIIVLISVMASAFMAKEWWVVRAISRIEADVEVIKSVNLAGIMERKEIKGQLKENSKIYIDLEKRVTKNELELIKLTTIKQ